MHQLEPPRSSTEQCVQLRGRLARAAQQHVSHAGPLEEGELLGRRNGSVAGATVPVDVQRDGAAPGVEGDQRVGIGRQHGVRRERLDPGQELGEVRRDPLPRDGPPAAREAARLIDAVAQGESRRQYDDGQPQARMAPQGERSSAPGERDPRQDGPQEAIGAHRPHRQDREVGDEGGSARRARGQHDEPVHADDERRHRQQVVDGNGRHPPQREDGERAWQVERSRGERAQTGLPDHVAVRPVAGGNGRIDPRPVTQRPPPPPERREHYWKRGEQRGLRLHPTHHHQEDHDANPRRDPDRAGEERGRCSDAREHSAPGRHARPRRQVVGADDRGGQEESEQRLGQEGGEHSEDRHREACSGDDDGGEPARRVRPEQLAARGVPRDEPCPHGREAHVEHLAGERRNRDRERAKQRGEEQGVKWGKVHGGGRAGQIRVDVPESMPEGPP